MQYPIIDNLIYAYLRNGWTGLDIPDTIDINYYQDGSGEPSPDNVRTIYPGAIINIDGIDIPIYDGVLDVNTGVLTVNKELLIIPDNEGWTKQSGLAKYFSSSPNSGYIVPQDALLPQSNSYAVELITGIGTFNYSYNALHIHNIGVCFSQDRRIGITEYVYLNNLWSNLQILYELREPIIYNLDEVEVAQYINGAFSNDIAHRLRLPLVRNFPHPVIDALISAADGQQTAEENEILRHYLTPLGIGGI